MCHISKVDPLDSRMPQMDTRILDRDNTNNYIQPPTNEHNKPHHKNTEYLQVLFSLFYTTPMVLNYLFTETSCSKNMTEPKGIKKYKNMTVHTKMSFKN